MGHVDRRSLALDTPSDQAEVRMRGRRPARIRNGETLGTVLLVLSLIHTPLPQPDFHNIRHHDGAGEVCEHHDHLLRWHPGATGARDVSILHWHWFLPGPPGSDPVPEGSGPAVHAHAPAWLAAAWGDDGPSLSTPESVSRLPARSVPSPFELPVAVPGPALSGWISNVGAHSPTAFCATFAPGTSVNTLLHRWIC